MNLPELQDAVFHAIRQPLTPNETMRQRLPDGRSTAIVASGIIKPNDRLTSFERLEIYNRQYWFRILSALADDFPGLKAVLGEKRFEKLSVAYLSECPSRSFTLRNLGSRLEEWLRGHLAFAAGVEELAIDMVRLEWAEVEAFDGEARPTLGPSDLAELDPDPTLSLQPYVRLLALSYPVDEWLLKIRNSESDNDVASNAVVERAHGRRKRRPALPRPSPTYVAVHRSDYSVYFKRLEPQAYRLLVELSGDGKLSEVMERVDWGGLQPEEIAARLQTWFANWASLGWFYRSE